MRRNFTAIYQDLVDRFGFTPGYNSVKRFAPWNTGWYQHNL
jgi:hypothetical protein